MVGDGATDLEVRKLKCYFLLKNYRSPLDAYNFFYISLLEDIFLLLTFQHLYCLPFSPIIFPVLFLCVFVYFSSWLCIFEDFFSYVMCHCEIHEKLPQGLCY